MKATEILMNEHRLIEQVLDCLEEGAGRLEDGEEITFTSPKTGKSNKVAKSDGCMPVMDLPDAIPNDLDYSRYIEITIKALKDVGVEYG